jgi:ATP-dependent DNA helicase RecQ
MEKKGSQEMQLRMQARQRLKAVFGFNDFLPNQEEIVAAVLSGRDVFAVMPTGGGKSLCYQLPALALEGTCVVVSPLISLMKDQVDSAVAAGLRAAFLNSSLTAPQKRQVESALARGDLDLLYISPERFAMPACVALLKRAPLAFFAVDEAHCISEWGHDFRPDYLKLAEITSVFPDIPLTAFTATATHRVQEDILNKLGLRNPHRVRASFNRPNLFYKVVPKQKPTEQILGFVRARAGEPGIVYRTTRKSVEQTAQALVRHGIRALPYHAGLSDAERIGNQEAFNRDEAEVVVATIAFGMGIDKSNVRYVLHGDLPKNMEGYYQETGRAGRDGEPARCVLLFGYGDLPKMRSFIDPIPDENERARALRALRDMAGYATRFVCRRRQLLAYFGETLAAPADAHCCDVCAGEVDSVDITRDAQIVLSAIARTGNRFGIGHIVSVVTGENTDRMRALGHDRLKTFGVGSHADARHWRQVVDALLSENLIAQTTGDYPVLQLRDAAREVLFDGRAVRMLQTRRTKTGRKGVAMDAAAGDEALFRILRELRRRIAAEQGVPPYVVFTDRTLREMTRLLPANQAEMLRIGGVGENRLARYGAPFIEEIRAYSTKNSGHPAASAPKG